MKLSYRKKRFFSILGPLKGIDDFSRGIISLLVFRESRLVDKNKLEVPYNIILGRRGFLFSDREDVEKLILFCVSSVTRDLGISPVALPEKLSHDCLAECSVVFLGISVAAGIDGNVRGIFFVLITFFQIKIFSAAGMFRGFLEFSGDIVGSEILLEFLCMGKKRESQK